MLGIEAVCRLSKAISVAPANGDIAWSQTGVTCGVGAALAAARLLQLGPETARMAVGIAAAGASGSRALHGSMCTAALPAFAGQSGLRAALLARGGITATLSVIEARNSFAPCFALTPHLAYLTDWEAPGHDDQRCRNAGTRALPDRSLSTIERDAHSERLCPRRDAKPGFNAVTRARAPEGR
jgi:hypothetical protein